MSATYRPRLTKPQLEDIKSDIKLMNRLMVAELGFHKGFKYPVTKSQNGYARQYSFDSYAEMNSKAVPDEHHEGFCITNSLTTKDFLEIYTNLGLKGSVNYISEGHVENALVEFGNRKYALPVGDLTLADLRQYLNDSELVDHHYTEDCGFPSGFNAYTTDSIIGSLEHGDHLKVVNGDDHCYFTLFAFNHIYTDIKMFEVVSGKWWNIDESPFCTGNK